MVPEGVNSHFRELLFFATSGTKRTRRVHKDTPKKLVFSGAPRAGGACLMRYDQTRIREYKTQHECTYKRIKVSPNGP